MKSGGEVKVFPLPLQWSTITTRLCLLSIPYESLDFVV